jgi:hypothetical protein
MSAIDYTLSHSFDNIFNAIRILQFDQLLKPYLENASTLKDYYDSLKDIREKNTIRVYAHVSGAFFVEQMHVQLPGNFARLPEDMLQEISNFLTFDEALCLKGTCPYLRQLVLNVSHVVCSVNIGHEFYRILEKAALYRLKLRSLDVSFSGHLTKAATSGLWLLQYLNLEKLTLTLPKMLHTGKLLSRLSTLQELSLKEEIPLNMPSFIKDRNTLNESFSPGQTRQVLKTMRYKKRTASQALA